MQNLRLNLSVGSRLRLAFVAATLAAFGISTTGSSAGVSGGRIAFTAPVDGIEQVWTIGPDGTDIVQVTHFNDGVHTNSAVFSPSGRALLLRRDSAWFNCCGWQPRIWVVNDDGSGARQLARFDQPPYYSGDITPSWSPDGAKVVFARGDQFGRHQIFRMNADGSGDAQLVQGGPGENSVAPVYSPDGSKIAYARGTYFARQLHVMNTDGTDDRTITSVPGDISWASWSPDGHRLAFSVQRQVGWQTVHVIDVDGTNEQVLTDGTTDAFGPVFSPWGDQIAYTQLLPGDWRRYLFVMDDDGSNAHPVANAPAGAVAYSWTSTTRELVDTDPPVILCDTTDTVWHGTNVVVACTASDAGSGLVNVADASFSLATSVDPGLEDAAAATDSRQVCDTAGNCITAGPIGPVKVDRKAPQVSCQTPNAVWHGADVSLACAGLDTGAGLANAPDSAFSLSTSVAIGDEDADATTAARPVCDSVANCTTAGPLGPVKVDRRAPTTTITVPAAATYLLGQSVPASYFCVDGGSGLASCAGPVASGAPSATGSVGNLNFVVDAIDNAGNSSNQSVGYQVTYRICPLSDTTKPRKNKVKVLLSLCTSAGGNVSSASITVTARSIDGTALIPASAFAFGPKTGSGGGYSYDVDASRLSRGVHTLGFTASGDPVAHSITFQVK